MDARYQVAAQHGVSRRHSKAELTRDSGRAQRESAPPTRGGPVVCSFAELNDEVRYTSGLRQLAASSVWRRPGRLPSVGFAHRLRDCGIERGPLAIIEFVSLVVHHEIEDG